MYCRISAPVTFYFDLDSELPTLPGECQRESSSRVIYLRAHTDTRTLPIVIRGSPKWPVSIK